MTRRHRPMPERYIIVTECVGGSGRGDEQFLPTLKCWETRTTGRLWWKKTTSDFFPIKRFDARTPREEIVDYAWKHLGAAA